MWDFRKNGQTSNIIRFKLLDSSSSFPKGLTGLTNSSAGLVISTIADVEASATVYTQAGGTIQTITTLGTYAAPSASNCRFKEVDATNHPGLYEFQFADARFAVSNAKQLTISVSGSVTNLVQSDITVMLSAVDPGDAVRFGMSSLPNVVSGSAGAIPTTGTGANQIQVNGSGGVSHVVLTDTLTTYTGNTPQTGDSFARIGATGSGLTSLAAAATALSTAAMTESYAANGAAPTPYQIWYAIYAILANIKGGGTTTLTATKLDGSTAAMTFTLDNASTPTQRLRAT